MSGTQFGVGTVGALLYTQATTPILSKSSYDWVKVLRAEFNAGQLAEVLAGRRPASIHRTTER